MLAGSGIEYLDTEDLNAFVKSLSYDEKVVVIGILTQRKNPELGDRIMEKLNRAIDARNKRNGINTEGVLAGGWKSRRSGRQANYFSGR